MSLVEERVVDNILDIDLVALGQKQQRLRIPRRRGQQALAVAVLAHALEQRPHGAAHLLQPLLGRLGPLINAAPGAAARPAQSVEVSDRARRPPARGQLGLLSGGLIARVAGGFTEAVATLLEGGSAAVGKGRGYGRGIFRPETLAVSRGRFLGSGASN